MKIDITAVATIISSTLAKNVALRINKSNAKKALNGQLEGIVKITIQYLYLEITSFANTWTANRNSDTKNPY